MALHGMGVCGLLLDSGQIQETQRLSIRMMGSRGQVRRLDLRHSELVLHGTERVGLLWDTEQTRLCIPRTESIGPELELLR